MMEIYFAGSIRGAEADKSLFKRFIEHLASYGKVLTEHSFDFDYSQEIKLDDHEIYKLDTGWLKDADAHRYVEKGHAKGKVIVKNRS